MVININTTATPIRIFSIIKLSFRNDNLRLFYLFGVHLWTLLVTLSQTQEKYEKLREPFPGFSSHMSSMCFWKNKTGKL